MQTKSMYGMLFGAKKSVDSSDLDILQTYFNYMPKLKDISLLSAQYYEKQEMKAKIVFLEDDSKVEYNPKYIEKTVFDTNSIRQVTKSLVAANGFPIVMKFQTTEEGIGQYVLSGISSTKEVGNIALFTIDFKGHMHYSFFVGQQHVLDYCEGSYIPPKDKEWNKLVDKMKSFGVDEKDIDKFIENVAILSNAGHGSTLVFCGCSTFYKQEVERLRAGRRGIEIKSISLFENTQETHCFLENTSVADGGFFVDKNGDCALVHVIFDGEIAPKWKESFKGKTERGSRYNSLSTYTFARNKQCMFSKNCKEKPCKFQGKRVFAIVISDDGMFDIM